MTAGNGGGLPLITPLEMAANAARAVLMHADFQARDPLGSYIARSGAQAMHSAEVAACMAAVSIAEDLHRIADVLAPAEVPADDKGPPS